MHICSVRGLGNDDLARAKRALVVAVVGALGSLFLSYTTTHHQWRSPASNSNNLLWACAQGGVPASLHCLPVR
jgi:hypothetical protein